MGSDYIKKTWRHIVGIRHLRIPTVLREDISLMAIIFAAALFLRVYFAIVVQYSPNRDILDKMSVFDGMALGKGWDAVNPPLYPLFLRVLYAFSGAFDHQAVFIVQGVLSSLIVIFMYVSGRMLCNRAAGVTAAAISAVYPNFLLYNIKVYPDSLAMIVVVLIMAAAMLRMREKRRACLWGALIGIGILVKPLLAFLLPGMILTSRKKVLVIAVAAAILAPWTIRNSIVRQSVTPVYGGAAYEIDLRKFSTRYEKWGPVHKLYYNASTLLRKGWAGSIDGAGGQKRNSNYIVAYAYLFVMICGLLGLARFYEKHHRPLVWPIMSYIVLLIPLCNVRLGHRIFIEPLWVLYSAVLLARIGELVLKKLQAARSRNPGQAAPA